jgi:N-acetylmuramoyl-L-alanine amidase
MELAVRNIVIDLGHGGVDPEGNYTTAPAKMFTFPDGKVVYEGVLNRQIGGLVGALLETHNNLNVVYTVREDDYRDVSLGDRVRIANEHDPGDSILLSFHCNAGGGEGFEIFTTRGVTKSDHLAELICDSVESLYEESGSKMRYDLSDGDKDKEVDFYVLRKSMCPAVLLELGFFDNIKDVELLEDQKFQCDLAFAIYDGILNYIYQ